MSKFKIKWLLAIILVLGAFAFGFSALFQQNSKVVASSSAPRFTDASIGGYARAIKPVTFSFPQDHGPHPEFQTEWWYYTGNLQAENGEQFGYQLTFFRRAIQPATAQINRQSKWATNQFYLAHFGLTSTSQRNFSFFERFSRGSLELAGAQGLPNFKVWLEDWSVEQTADKNYRLFARENDLQIDLTLAESKPLVFHGDRGLSQKGPQDGNASYYISQTRLQTKGTIILGSKEVKVTGESWMDHEYSTSALGAGQIGWDWFSLQLDDGSELMVYTIRKKDGSIDPYSKGTIIRPDGSTRGLSVNEFQIQVTNSWRSPNSGAVYPAKWIIRVPDEKLELTITPKLPDQELRVSFTYWEGAVEITGTAGSRKIIGSGYVELTGYAQSMEGQF